VFELALMGPAIGGVFDNIVDEVEKPESYNPMNGQPVLIQNEDPTQQILALLDYAIRIVGSSSISTTVTPEGGTNLRVVLTFNPQ
ncbi:MAG TPA: hypothetical protein VHL11_04180, partial [Phototrophicaceae bacterium]|nr:hypothetical protein [Phototrophicaceae bacterium]